MQPITATSTVASPVSTKRCQLERNKENRFSMKVTNVRTFLVCPGRGKNWLFVKVETDEGIYTVGVSVIHKLIATEPSRFTFISLDVTSPAEGPSISSILLLWLITILLVSAAQWTFIVPSVG